MEINPLSFRYLYDAQDVTEFIKKLVKAFRISEEYAAWRQSLHSDKCAATGFDKFNDSAEIEVHHYGKTLKDIVTDVVFYFLDNELPINTFYLLLIIQEIHLSDCIDYVPLLHCIHVMLERDYDETIQKYPNILDGVHYGVNKSNIPFILEKYKNNLEDILKG